MTEISDEKWKRRLALYEMSKPRLLRLLAQVEREAGNPVIYRAHPPKTWQKHDLVSAISDIEEAYKVGAFKE